VSRTPFYKTTKSRKSESARAKGRESLTRADVVAAGAKLLDAQGIDGVSMRKLATALGTGVATLYWHVHDKDELLGAILEDAMREVRAPRDGRWDARLLELLRTGRRSLRGKPALIQVIWRSGWELGPETLRVVDEMIGLIGESPTPDAEVADAYYALTTFLFGFVAAEATSPGTARYRGGREGAAFANLARYRPAADAAGMDRRFEAGITRFVASLRRPHGRG
jgi:TetR/AcrR family transcriptional regulator, tetracycline repressor protein